MPAWIFTPLSPYHSLSMVPTIGAAVVAPNPPFSTVATITIGRLALGTKAAYQAWSGLPARSAVPVLPYTGYLS